jgi:hypothetical protein
MDWPQNEYRQGLADLMSYENAQNEVFLPAYAIGLKDLTAGRLMDAAVLTGWRAFMPQPGGGALFAEMSLASGSHGSVLGTVSQGDRAQEALKALRAVEARPEVKSCEIRWLSVPGVLFEGFWLKSNDANQPDSIIPVFTLDDSLRLDRMAAADFLAIAQPFGVNRLKYTDFPQYGQA